MTMDFVAVKENNGIFMLHSGLIKLSLIHHSGSELVHIILNVTLTTELRLILNQEVTNFSGITEP
jgi:hypothetical protein